MTLSHGRIAAGFVCAAFWTCLTAAVFAQNLGFPQQGQPPGGVQQSGPQAAPYGPQAAGSQRPPQGGPQNAPQQFGSLRGAQQEPQHAAIQGPQQGPQPGSVQGPQQAPPVRMAAPPRVPVAPFELTPPQEKYLDQILDYWEYKSRQIQRFRCKFTRWEYDPVFGPKDPYTAKTESTGTIMYSAPDKGLFKVEKIYHYVTPQNPAEQPRYEDRQGEVGEHWVCDGASVFEYNHQQKKLIQYELPPDMRGQAIAASPLPFVFGANAKEIKERFWMRAVRPPEGSKNEFWLEAYPKRQSDAVNYQKLMIILDEQEYLPKGIEVYDPTYDHRRNPKRTAFVFEEREANWNVTLQKLNLFHKEFYEPALPSGWQKEVQRFNQSPAAPAQAPGPQAALNRRTR